MQQEIVPISTNERGVQFCDARQLHGAIEVGRDFSNWIRGRIEEYGFVKDEDYFVEDEVLSDQQCGGAKGGGLNDQQRGRPLLVNYRLTLDMAKELGMLENNDTGRRVRRYFIRAEKLLREQAAQHAEALRIAGLERLDGRIKALERIAPDYPVQEGAKRFTVMSAYQEDCRNWVKYRKNKDLEMSHGSVYEHPLTLLFQGWQPYARLDEVATIVGLSMPQVKKLAPSDEFLEFEGIHYICTNRLPEPLVAQ